MEGHEEQLITDVLLSHGFKETGRFLNHQLLADDNSDRVVQLDCLLSKEESLRGKRITSVCMFKLEYR